MATKQIIIVTGVKEIDRRLRTLAPRIAKKVIKQSMRKGLKLIAAEVKRNAPVLHGITKENVQTRAVKKRRRDQIELEVKIGGSDERLYKDSAKGRVFYPAIVEYKHNAFMRRSFVAKGEQARQVTLVSLKTGIEIEAGKP